MNLNKSTVVNIELSPYYPIISILGVWCSEYCYEIKNSKIEGSFTVHLWYSKPNKETEVMKKVITFTDDFQLDILYKKLISELPKCVNAKLVRGVAEISILCAFKVEV